MCISQHKAGRKFVFEHPALASSRNLPCLRRLADFSIINSFDSDLLRIYTNSETIDELIDKRCSPSLTVCSWRRFMEKERCGVT